MPRKVSTVIGMGCPRIMPTPQAPTLDEAVERIKEAIELYLETLSLEERDAHLSEEILTTSVEVNVA